MSDEWGRKCVGTSNFVSVEETEELDKSKGILGNTIYLLIVSGGGILVLVIIIIIIMIKRIRNHNDN